MWSKNVSVNSVDAPFISERMQRCVWALPETLTDSCDYLTSRLTTQMPDTCSIQLQAGRRLSLRFLLDYSNPPYPTTTTTPSSPLLLFPPLSFITHSSLKKQKNKVQFQEMLLQYFDTFVRNTSQKSCVSGEHLKKIYSSKLKAKIFWNTYKAKNL